jgi:hypothetical protein
MLQVFHVDVAKQDQDVAYVANVSEACCKRLCKMFHMFSECMFASVFYLDGACFSHMLQEYVPMVSVVSILCCSECFYVCKLQVFYLDVAFMFHTCFKSMFKIFYLLHTYVAFKCFAL